MLNKVLIANRGEIACRIARSARAMGIASVAVYSDADRDALHVRACDEAVHIGPSPAVESYLRIDKILAAAEATGADAIHPGYGFLAENAEFADAVSSAGLTFIGPSGEAMRALGGKAAAKTVARAADVPVVPGYDEDDQAPARLAKEAEAIGFPVMIKAVAGGGGRGMRRVDKRQDFSEALASAQREAASAFGNDAVLIEKLIERPRHIEVQVFGDRHGNVVHLFERECTLQRRNQKVIEEAPAPDMPDDLRTAICEAAVRLAKSVGYEGAGTVEFLVPSGQLTGATPFYFIEMNTRLQVEHPVTEEITGLDLVEWQFRVAAGEELPRTQDDIAMTGHAIEARICAEDPSSGFQPQSGRIHSMRLPRDGGARIETGVEPGSVIPPDYDSLIAKVIVSAPDRARALDQLRAKLSQSRILGPVVNIAFLVALLDHSGVRAGTMHTGLIDQNIGQLTAAPFDAQAAAKGALAHLVAREATAHVDRPGPWQARDAFQLGPQRVLRVPLIVDGGEIEAVATWDATAFTVAIDGYDAAVRAPVGDHGIGIEDARVGSDVYIWNANRQTIVAWPTFTGHEDDGDASDHIRAPINGRVAKLFVTAGQAVAAGERVAIVEAMKMEHVMTAPRDGEVLTVDVAEGAQVSTGQLLVALVEENTNAA